MALTRSTDPLVWVDCEMTGLDPRTDTILSISVLLTTAELTPLEPHGLTLYITHTETQLASMSEWCITTHTATGLTTLCLDPTTSTTASLAAAQILQYIQTHIPTPRTALLAGNSIHADRGFLMVPPWDAILSHLHYRLFDVSAMKEMVRRWAPPEVLAAAPVKQLRHSAREDVLESIDEAAFYMALLQTSGNRGGGAMLPSPPRPALTSVPFSTAVNGPSHFENGAGSTTDPMDISTSTNTISSMQPSSSSLPSNFQADTKQDQETLERMHRLLNNNGNSNSNFNFNNNLGSLRGEKHHGDNNSAHGFRTDVP